MYLYFSSSFLKKTALDTLLQTQLIYDISLHLRHCYYFLGKKKYFSSSVLLKILYIFYHFIGPYVDGQRSTPIWQYLKAFRRDELKKTEDGYRRTKSKHRGMIIFLTKSSENVFIMEVFALDFVVVFLRSQDNSWTNKHFPVFCLVLVICCAGWFSFSSAWISSSTCKCDMNYIWYKRNHKTKLFTLCLIWST